MISLQEVTKIYPGQLEPAVDNLDLVIPDGEICVLVGPSGCGKTTTMKMVNRLIEPTSGKIMVEEMDVLEMSPIQLRRSIGYVIQEIGLFPHMTIAENIATVPRLLEWDEVRINNRVDELFEIMDMEPHEYRDRYPRELSGGQRQRIGVARAMAADPHVMLMDEPFGAIDPITRERLQNEFLKIQRRIRKTIIFVTHDIDEAIKMGDKIALLNVGGVLEQYGPPSEILSNPANQFVEDFVGSDRALKWLNLVRVDEVMIDRPKLAEDTQDVSQALQLMKESEYESIYVIGADRVLKGYVTEKHIKGKEGWVGQYLQPVAVKIESGMTLRDALSEMLASDYQTSCVVDEEGRVRGLIDLDTIQQTLKDRSGKGA
ncbi:MAG: ABC transporter ATP-binding protein [Anaerolineales bacterium]|jgi:osmoprotectant transport system ATP-binding protein